MTVRARHRHAVPTDSQLSDVSPRDDETDVSVATRFELTGKFPVRRAIVQLNTR